MSNIVKNIALYLPQFHAIPENDKAWGKGFTEWSNTTTAEPLFDGHYQPHEPHDDIGYYNLEDVNVMIKQATLAKKYGIYGFSYYYYWFDGKKLMEKPLKNMLKEPKVDIPFCLFWANHSWTKAWDTGNKEIILEQKYDENKYTQFIDDLSEYFADRRYIRINKKPILLVYQINDIPNVKNAVKVWRTYAKEKYKTELFLISVQQNNMLNPLDYGFDAALEGAPNFIAGASLIDKSQHPKMTDPKTDVILYDYMTNIFQYILRKKESYKLFRMVYGLWDNTARRKKKGSWMFMGATPEKFKKFLIEMTLYTIKTFRPQERFLFINAWNEWAEGAHLEPDKKYGYKFLEICKDVSSMTLSQLKKNCFDKLTKAHYISLLNLKGKQGITIKTYYLFGFIPFIRIHTKRNMCRINLFNFIPLFKTKIKEK